MLRNLGICALSLLAVGSAYSAPIQIIKNTHGNTQITGDQFQTLRCNPEGQTAYIMARGSMYGQLEGKAPVHMFNFEGVDISRCIEHEGKKWLVSRKISLYQDPETLQKLENWENPFTGEALNVLHRTYDYQEFAIPEKMNALHGNTFGFASIDFLTFLPNRLATLPEYKEYSGNPFLQSVDSYKFVYEVADLENQGEFIPAGLTYQRSGPFEPWMKMGDAKGKLVLNYSGTKVASFDKLSSTLKKLIQEKMPLYLEAPTCRLKKSIGTSWSRFQGQFKAYLAGEQFPLPAPIVREDCI